MFNQIYIHNYKCFQNFEFKCKDEKSLLLFGKNGVGKSSILQILMILRDIANGENKLDNLFQKSFFLDSNSPLNISIEIQIGSDVYSYVIQVEYPEHFYEPKIYRELLSVNNESIYSRNDQGVVWFNNSEFVIDWHSVALPLLIPHNYSEESKLFAFRNWLAKMILISPIPSLMSSEFEKKSSILHQNTNNFSGWLALLLSKEPGIYSNMQEILNRLFPDFSALTFNNSNKLTVRFRNNSSNNSLLLAFDELSDGEKIYIIYATLIALVDSEEPFFCFWDEPENYISIAMLENLITLLRSKIEMLQDKQIFLSSHNGDIINTFSTSSIYKLSRFDHFSPTRIENQEKAESSWDIIQNVKFGELYE